MSSKRNENKVRNSLLLTLALVISFLLGVISPIELFNDERKESAVLTEVYSLLKDNWYYGEDEEIIGRALSAMTSNEMDKFTYVMDPGSSIMSEYYSVGMGIMVTDYGGALLVTKVLSGSAAFMAGLKKYDVIKSANINGTFYDFSDKTYNEITRILKFQLDDQVVLNVDRAGIEKTINITISEYTANTVEYVPCSGCEEKGIFMVNISEFGIYSTSELKKVFKDHSAENNDTLIIDLRDNPGGYVDTVVSMASLFLPKNTVVMGFEYRDGKKEYLKDNDGITYHFDNIYIMVNNQSASGAEALTSCFKENAEAMNSNVYVVGQNTYGKGSAQKDFVLSNNYILHMTFALWIGPNGNTINKVGVAPSAGYEIERNDYDKAQFNWAKDLKLHDQSDAVLALQYALDILGKDVYLSGYFDKISEDAVKELQHTFGISETGIVDLNTYNHIRKAIVDKQYEDFENEVLQVINWAS